MARYKTLKGLLGALDRLPPGKIAELLGEEGVTGCVGIPTMCPLAKYVTARLGFTDASVSIARLTCRDMGALVSYDHGPHLRAFVRNFDGGGYPGLIRHTIVRAM